jgi:hypothetical protein
LSILAPTAGVVAACSVDAGRSSWDRQAADAAKAYKITEIRNIPVLSPLEKKRLSLAATLPV